MNLESPSEPTTSNQPQPTLLGAMEETGSLPDDLETPIGLEWDSGNEKSEL